MLVLASASPRRREILQAAGIPFESQPANVDETLLPGESAEAHVRRLARKKADAVHGDLVLGADTVVVVGETILGKPADARDASRMLRLLSGRDHFVLTGICLRTDREARVDSASTLVRFMTLSDAEIADYVASGEPMDKAGAYAIQGLASKFIERIVGCYFNVVGLPISLVYKHLKEL
jgi:septum formation protein